MMIAELSPFAEDLICVLLAPPTALVIFYGPWFLWRWLRR